MSSSNPYSAIQEPSSSPPTYRDPYQSIALAELPPSTMLKTTKDPAVVESTVTMDEEEEEMLRKGMVDWNALKKKDFCQRLRATTVGVVLAGESSTTKSSHVVSDIVWAVTAVVSIGAGWYIWWKMSKVRIEVWREMRDEMALKGVPDYELPPQVDAEGHVMNNNDYRGFSGHDGAHPLPTA
ncbi:hypothetical protein QFC22_003996 [Naganishia vaughanmartiniae]|uniref:Uncharacterized protein n=1 Tax=Naganishia vaughanmartiniae TaxID=1424756 RepID=A0ACC2X5S1_9TREE|nr:hypothetical protein QFC22_003996 [Naganishia vaughanmartiniae]